MQRKHSLEERAEEKQQQALCEGRYEIEEKVGEGTYGVVYFAYDRLKQRKVAVKKVKYYGTSNEGIPATTLREISILKELQHKHIVRLEEVITTGAGGEMYLVFERMDMDLRRLLKVYKQKFPPVLMKKLLKQLLEGVHHLHERKILHRDLKPDNVLVSFADDYVAKICDFGLSRTIHQPLRTYTTEVMSLWYRCPELLENSNTYSIGVDTWAIGCIFAEMMRGVPLFPARSELEMLALIRKLHDDPKTFTDLFAAHGSDAVHLLQQLLHVDPLLRYTCKQALAHPFFTD